MHATRIQILAVATVAWLFAAPCGLRAAESGGDDGAAGSAMSQETEKPADVVAKPTRYPIRGRLKAVDEDAQTFTLAGSAKDRVFEVTEQTELIRDGKPATLADAVVGDLVGGYVERQADGSIVVLKARFGPKTDAEKAATGKKKSKAT